jgi:hypothetical protein
MPKNPEYTIFETRGSNNSPTLAEGHTNKNPQDNKKMVNDIECYLNVVQ